MCGRLFMRLNPQQLQQVARCQVVRNAQRYRSSYNVGPTNYLPCIRKNTQQKSDQEVQKEQNTGQKDIIQQSEDQFKQNTENTSDPIAEEEGCQASDLFVTAKHLFCKEQQQQNQMQEIGIADNQFEQDNQDNSTLSRDRMLDFMYWGFSTDFQNIINIRSEEAEMKKTFKPLLNKNRCVCITQGYYEWTPDKIPYVFYNSKKDYMMICGIYSEESEQVMLLTRESFGKFDQVHHRMPVFIEEEEVELWLNPNIEYKDVLFNQLLKRDRSVYDEISSYRCSNNVNNIREQSVKCLMSYEEHKKHLEKNGIGKFFKQNKIQEEKKNDEANTQSYYKRELSKQLTQETNELAVQFEKTNFNDTKDGDGLKSNLQSLKTQSVESENNNQIKNNSESQQSKQKTPLQNKQNYQINSLKKERTFIEQEQQKQQQLLQSSTKKSNKLVKPSANNFLEGLEQFFQNKNNQKK